MNDISNIVGKNDYLDAFVMKTRHTTTRLVKVQRKEPQRQCTASKQINMGQYERTRVSLIGERRQKAVENLSKWFYSTKSDELENANLIITSSRAACFATCFL